VKADAPAQREAPAAGAGLRVAVCTAAALCCFAANSLLARAALAGDSIDAASFTAVRLASGAGVLALLVRAAGGSPTRRGSWLGALALFAYAIAFSLAYLRIGAGTGALILFGTVQVTMIGRGMYRGERPRPVEWLGMALAVAGLVALTRPGLHAPDPAGALGMALAGGAWAVYTLLGRGTSEPLQATAGNFLRSLLPTALLLAVMHRGLRAEPAGIALAVASGAIASGLGYSVWYAALPRLSATRAGLVQLAVPALAAGGAVVLLHEPLTLRLVLASALVFGGILVAQLAPSALSGPRPGR
jgi:drug/metabolite transporter (DMT)-like permease